MADDNNEILFDREKAIAENYSPFGRQYGVKMEDQYGLYRIQLIDGKNGSIPDALAGRWTSIAACESHLKAFLRKQWDFSEEKQSKANKPLAKSTNGKRQHEAVQ
jgi:hypothetical protein